jgi:hypothetical protein
MSLVIVALLLFLALVIAWVVLPGSVVAGEVQESLDPMPVNAAGQTA